jgi:hypothetical protein
MIGYQSDFALRLIPHFGTWRALESRRAIRRKARSASELAGCQFATVSIYQDADEITALRRAKSRSGSSPETREQPSRSPLGKKKGLLLRY